MTETKEGNGTLRSKQNQGKEWAVSYHIDFHTSLRTVRSGFPPVTQVKAVVNTVKAEDGTPIPEGTYLLDCGDEFIHLQNLGWNDWHVVSGE